MAAGWEYDPNAIEFQHVKGIQERNRFRRPASHDQEPDNIVSPIDHIEPALG